eukprot:1115711-Rhodomonas_salina.6
MSGTDIEAYRQKRKLSVGIAFIGVRTQHMVLSAYARAMRCLVLTPRMAVGSRLVLLDEPTAGMDIQVRLLRVLPLISIALPVYPHSSARTTPTRPCIALPVQRIHAGTAVLQYCSTAYARTRIALSVLTGAYGPMQARRRTWDLVQKMAREEGRVVSLSSSATRLPCDRPVMTSAIFSPIVLRAPYEMSGTDVEYAGTRR